MSVQTGLMKCGELKCAPIAHFKSDIGTNVWQWISFNTCRLLCGSLEIASPSYSLSLGLLIFVYYWRKPYRIAAPTQNIKRNLIFCNWILSMSLGISNSTVITSRLMGPKVRSPALLRWMINKLTKRGNCFSCFIRG